MAVTKFTGNVNNVGSLPDKPTIDSTELKRIFDQAGIDIKAYINEVLTEDIDEIESKLTTSIASKLEKAGGTISGNLSVTGDISGTWGGYSQHYGTENTSNTELLVLKNNEVQHRTIPNIINTYGLKKITTGTGAPSGGANGDVYIQYF